MLKKKSKKIEIEILQSFGEYLKKQRMKTEYTQLDVARKCGFVNAQFISNIERGLCWPTMDLLRTMSDLYSIDPQEILYRLMDAKKVIWKNELGILTTKKNAKK